LCALHFKISRNVAPGKFNNLLQIIVGKGLWARIPYRSCIVGWWI